VIEAILVVFTKPRAGRDDDFNDWYSNIHIRDALRFRGSIATQRFKFSPGQVQTFAGGFHSSYLALYEVFDAERFTQEHIDNALTTRMMVSDAIDDTVLDDFHYYPLQFRDNAPLASHGGGVILEQINPAPGRESDFEAWYNDDYLPNAVKRPGVRSGGFLVFRASGQLLPMSPSHSYVGIYRTQGPEAVAAWKASTALSDSPLVNAGDLAVTCWDPIADRLTKDAVFHPSAAALAAEEKARARMGDRVVTNRGMLRTE
jgi:hypothetical protein